MQGNPPPAGLNWDEFDVGLWHTAGRFGNKDPQDIFKEKIESVRRTDEAYWCFRAPAKEVVAEWRSFFQSSHSAPWVMCSHSPKARDPSQARDSVPPSDARSIYAENRWTDLPRGATRYHFKKRGLALSFRIKKVIPLNPAVPAVHVAWTYRSSEAWNEKASKIPPRPLNFLIRRGGASLLREVAAIFILKAPFVSFVSDRPADEMQSEFPELNDSSSN